MCSFSGIAYFQHGITLGRTNCDIDSTRTFTAQASILFRSSIKKTKEIKMKLFKSVASVCTLLVAMLTTLAQSAAHADQIDNWTIEGATITTTNSTQNSPYPEVLTTTLSGVFSYDTTTQSFVSWSISDGLVDWSNEIDTTNNYNVGALVTTTVPGTWAGTFTLTLYPPELLDAEGWGTGALLAIVDYPGREFIYGAIDGSSGFVADHDPVALPGSDLPPASNSVPEPITTSLFAIGLLALFAFHRRSISST